MLLNALIKEENAAGLTSASNWLASFNELEKAAQETESFPTKAAQKDTIGIANKLLEGMFDKVVEDSGLLAMDLSCGSEAAVLGSDVYYTRAAVHTIKTLNRRVEKFAEVSEVGKIIKPMMGDINAIAERAKVLKGYEINKVSSEAQSEDARKVAAWKSLPKASAELVETLIKQAKGSLDAMDARLERSLRSIRNSYEAAQNMSEADKNVAMRHLRTNHQSSLALALKPREETQAFIKAQRTMREDAIRYGATERLGGLGVKNVISSKVEPGIAVLSYSCRLDTNEGEYRFSFQGVIAGGYNIQSAHLRITFDLKKEK
ncbi:hypothetical protein BM525_18895 (plasmid) [Alteromonas mediterranea]|uniref:Uncharacterized protein n=1 Tax=Alteromonas mediterranea TaxID=314275 RepID=A0AAC9NTS2_9ALTE|nr:hypothetical protein [Alteromonas mediterranea]APD91951.1 hypothetical protein BM524_18700 [Alteromonas mediterranea]APD99805.1 hypothetical protein BM525_18895 [Alteromonas mediterranea]